MVRKNDEKIKCLFLGYCGANNTGAESRLVTIIDDVRKTVGNKVEMSAAVLNKESVERYVKEDDVKLIEYSSFFFYDLLKIVPKHDVLILVEGSTFTDHFSPFLMYNFLYASKIAKKFNKKVVAYAVDCGNLKPLNQKIAKRAANKMDLLITRTKEAKERLQKYGVDKEITVTTDSAFTFAPQKEEHTQNLLTKLGINPDKPIIGIAPKEFFWWPVTMKLLGKKEDCYRYPYYHTWGKGDKENSKRVKTDFANYADWCAENFDANILLFCMEHMDNKPSEDIHQMMKHKDKATLIRSDDYNAKEITGLLSKSEFLVSTRYHACVLSIQSAIPMMAVSHDVRCESLFKEMQMMDYYLPHTTPNLHDTLVNKTNSLMKNKNALKTKVGEAYPKYLETCLQNRVLFKKWFEQTFK